MKKKKILLINLQGIGDFIMTTPLIESLYELYDVDYLTLKKINGDIVKEKRIKKFYFAKKNFFSRIKLLLELNSRNYDYIFLTVDQGIKSIVFFSLLRAKVKISHKYKVGIFNFPFFSDILLDKNFKNHRVKENLKFSSFLKLKIKDKSYKIKSIPKIKKNKKKITIGIHPGGDKSNLEKRYPLNFYLKFVNNLNQKYHVLFFLGPDEIDLRDKILSKINNKNFDIIEEKNILNLFKKVKECDYLINSDSSIGHIASALKVKTLTLCGSTNWFRTCPYGNLNKNLIYKDTQLPKKQNIFKGFIEKNKVFKWHKITLKDLK